MPLNSEARSRLSQKFADILLAAQEEYHDLQSALRNPDIDLDAFTHGANDFRDKLVRLKRLHVRLSRARKARQRPPSPTGNAA